MSLLAAFWTRCRRSQDRVRKCCQNGVAVVHSGCHKSRHSSRIESSRTLAPVCRKTHQHNAGRSDDRRSQKPLWGRENPVMSAYLHSLPREHQMISLATRIPLNGRLDMQTDTPESNSCHPNERAADPLWRARAVWISITGWRQGGSWRQLLDRVSSF